MGNVNLGFVFAFASLWSFFKMSFVVVVIVVDSSEAFVGRMSRYYGSVIRNCTWYSKGKQEGITEKLFTGYAVFTECSLIVMKKNVFLSQLAERFFRLKVVFWRGTLKFVGLSKKYHPLTPCMYTCAFNIKSKYAGNHSSLWRLSVGSLRFCLLNF